MLSSNAPFNEFGQSMILRDIEQLYLSLNNAGRGSAGDGGTQDQATVADQNTGDSGGLPDLSGLATTDYVDAAIASIESVRFLYLYATSGLISPPSTGYTNCSYATVSGNLSGSLSGATFTAPYTGIYTIRLRWVARKVATGPASNGNFRIFSELTPPYGDGRSIGNINQPTVAGGETFDGYTEAQAVWTGLMASGETCLTRIYTDFVPYDSIAYYLHISGCAQ